MQLSDFKRLARLSPFNSRSAVDFKVVTRDNYCPMSKQTFFLMALVVVLSSNFVPVAEAREKAARKSTTSNVVSDESRSTAAAPAAPSRQQANVRFGFGVSTLHNTSPTGFSTSLTGILEINDLNMIQFTLNFPSVSPFQMGFGGYFKRTLSGNENTGFHLGGGLTMNVVNAGLGSTFGLGIPVIVGLHTTIADHVAFHFDAGPAVALTFPAGGTTFDLAAGAMSALLGASVVYMF